MKKALLTLLFLLSFSSFAEDNFDWLKIKPLASFEEFDWSVLPDGLSKEMVISLISNPLISSKDPITILPFDGKMIALLPCRLDVLIWSDEAWINLYKGNSSGFNCQAHFFFEDGVLYSYGKYGFWHAHSELMYFDFENGFWENLPAKNPPMNYAGVSVFKTNGKLLTMMGQYIHQSSGLDKFEKDGFYFDFQSGEWFPMNVIMPDQPTDSNWMVPTFDLKGYGIHLFKYQAELGLLLFNKSNLRFYFSRMDYTPLFNENISFSKGNKLWFFDEKSGAIFLDFERGVDSSFQEIGKVELVEGWALDETESFDGLKNGIIIFLILLTIGLGAIIYFRRGTKKTEKIEGTGISEETISEYEADDEVKRIINLLTEYTNRSFEVDDFDQILGLNSIENLDYRRVRRSRLIKLINEYYLKNYGSPLIERTRFEQDKRIILYQINGKTGTSV